MRGTTGPLAWAFRTLVGGARRWLGFPLAAPSTSESKRHERDDRDGTAAESDVAPGRRTGPSDDAGERPDAWDDHDGSGNSGETVDSSDETDPDKRIRAALADNGGRLAQRDLPSVADLSQSAASRRLIAMEERGEVVRYEIGRGKTVFLPGEEPAAFQSPIESGDADPATTP